MRADKTIIRVLISWFVVSIKKRGCNSNQPDSRFIAIYGYILAVVLIQYSWSSLGYA